VAVEAGDRDVELAAHEPLGHRPLGPIEHAFEGLHPGQFPRHAPPEELGLVQGLPVHPFVVGRVREPGRGAEGFGRGEAAFLVEYVLDVVAHRL
jgi:hypothetical protein